MKSLGRWLVSVTGKAAFTLIGISIGVTLTVGAITLNATLKLIEKINIGPFSGMILNASSGSCVTIIGGAGNKTEIACGTPNEQQPTRVQIPESTEIVQNGGFEQGLEGWGTGFYEGLFRQNVVPVLFGGAVASWEPDQFAYKSRSALRVKHKSAYAPNVFSSMSQQVKLELWHRYEARYWAYIKDGDKFALRLIPSRVSSPEEWERYKTKPKSDTRGRWQEVVRAFESRGERFWDIRFTAEAPLTIWIDDVSVKDLGPLKPEQR